MYRTAFIVSKRPGSDLDIHGFIRAKEASLPFTDEGMRLPEVTGLCQGPGLPAFLSLFLFLQQPQAWADTVFF